MADRLLLGCLRNRLMGLPVEGPSISLPIRRNAVGQGAMSIPDVSNLRVAAPADAESRLPLGGQTRADLSLAKSAKPRGFDDVHRNKGFCTGNWF
ncbi:MAG: hypothetical protein RLZZ437_2825 [Pseudomonadota bacterium]|jgi:hypothetical protein